MLSSKQKIQLRVVGEEIARQVSRAQWIMGIHSRTPDDILEGINNRHRAIELLATIDVNIKKLQMRLIEIVEGK